MMVTTSIIPFLLLSMMPLIYNSAMFLALFLSFHFLGKRKEGRSRVGAWGVRHPHPEPSSPDYCR
jgi:hypothetical protein